MVHKKHRKCAAVKLGSSYSTSPTVGASLRPVACYLSVWRTARKIPPGMLGLAMRRVRLACCSSCSIFLKDQFFDSTSQMIIILLPKLIVCIYVKNSVHYQKSQSWYRLLLGYCEIYHEAFYGNSGVNGVHESFWKNNRNVQHKEISSELLTETSVP